MAFPHRLSVPPAWNSSRPRRLAALAAFLLGAAALNGCLEAGSPAAPDRNELAVAAAVTLTRQAETAALYGAFAASTQSGWTGTGYADYRNASGDYVRWTASLAEKGRYALRFRYANGGTASRPLSIRVNGTVIASSFAFPATGAWTTWKTVSLEANLIAGTNTIQATAIGSSGGNIDYLQVYGPLTSSSGGFAGVVSESMFNSMFPNRNAFYSYSGLVNATASYTAFANTGDLAVRKREAAAFLANVAHETGNLVYVEEINKADYCGYDWSGRCACQPGQRYYGRGPIQLSWNYNYGAAGAALGLPLCTDPGLVSRDSKVAWQTGLWFWMTQSGAGYRPCHQSMVGNYGFGETIRTINGSLECGGKNPAQVQSRIDKYKKFCQMLGVDPGSNLGC